MRVKIIVAILIGLVVATVTPTRQPNSINAETTYDIVTFKRNYILDNSERIQETITEPEFEPKITIHTEKMVENIKASKLIKVKEEKKDEEKVDKPEPLLVVDNEDKEYKGKRVKLDENNRALFERLVQGEAGGEGYIGAALVAQAIRDTMLLENEYSVLSIKRKYEYSGSLETKPNKDVKDAVKFILDTGGNAVNHRLIFFYAPGRCKSRFHESQNFIVEYGGHRFFDLKE